jgi:DoxX-like protein
MNAIVPTNRIVSPSRKRWPVWLGRALGGIATLFLLLDIVVKLVQPPAAVEGTMRLGYPAAVLVPLAVIQAACLALYLIPRTAVLGAVLWTGYLGGAVASHVRVGDALASHTLFPIYVAVFLWVGLWLRSPQLRSLLPFRRAH